MVDLIRRELLDEAGSVAPADPIGAAEGQPAVEEVPGPTASAEPVGGDAPTVPPVEEVSPETPVEGPPEEAPPVEP